MTNLVLTHLCFDCLAEDKIVLRNHWAGSYLRGALGRMLLRSAAKHDPHDPVNQLLAGQHDSGTVRRAYSVVPPYPTRESIAKRERFSFTVTLYGVGKHYIPYFVLAVNEMGRTGVGIGRGRFSIHTITAQNPLRDASECILASNEEIVRLPSLGVTWQDALNQANHWQDALDNGFLRIDFLSPTQLIHGKKRVKSADFTILFQRLLRRIDDLSQQFAAGERRSPLSIERLHTQADKVRLLKSDLQWIDMRPRSSRDGKHKPLSGFVGHAVYQTDVWADLLPYLLFGQGCQVGKLATKGNGVFQLSPI